MTARDELIAQVVAAIERGEATVCLTRCWACMLNQCPGGPHDWADIEDVEHAADTGQDDPTGQPCGCPCVNGPSLGPEPPDIDGDMDIESIDGPACIVCGESNACMYDAEGRALIHTTEDEDAE